MMRGPSDWTRTAAVTVAAVAMAGAVAAARQEDSRQRPSFRSGVELVTIDVTVSGRDGRPVPGLSAGDFTVTVDGQPRRVVSAEFVDLAAPPDTAREHAVPISTNEGAGVGRQIVFIVDQSTIDQGSARQVARAASRFLSGLTFADRTALILLPVGNNIGFTWSHDKVREGLQRVAGLSTSMAAWDYGSLSEARDIANQNPAALRIVGQRECGNALTFAGGPGPGAPTGGGATPPGGAAPPGTGTPPGGGAGAPPGGSGAASGAAPGGAAPGGVDSCVRQVRLQAESTWRMTHMGSLSSLASLRQALEAIGRVPGDKTVVLISGGYPLEQHEEVSSLSPLASTAAAARATLYPVFVWASRYAASERRLSATPQQDQSLHTGPLQTLAALTGGEFLRGDINVDAVFERLGRQMAGYYRVSVEKEPADRGTAARRLKVAVSRDGAAVRARELFDTRTFEDRDWTARLAAALDAPMPADGIPLRMTSYVALHPDDRSRLNIVLAGDARRIRAGATTVRVVVRDLEGRTLLSGEQPATETAEDALQFSLTVPVPPGSYVVRVGVLDSTGQVGSVEHRVDARRVAVGPIEAAGPLLVRVPVRAGGEPRIALGGARQDERLALEVGLDGGEELADAEVVFEIGRADGSPALVRAPAALSRGSSGGPWLAQAVVNMRVLPPGDYVALARIRGGGGVEGELRRAFAVTGPTSGEAPAAEGVPAVPGAPLPISARAAGAVQPFALDHVLAPQVLGGFLDRVAARPDAGSPDVRALIERARAEGVAALSVSESAAAGSPPAQFLRGLTLFSAGQLEPAAASFRGVLRAAPDFFPAMVYLGACYAAGGKDKEAAGAWQTALIGAGDVPAVHGLLVDALLRDGSAPRALQAVERARARWPGDPGLARRFIVAALLGGKPVEGLQAVDALLERRERADEPALVISLLVLYEAFEARRPIESAEADRARMFRLADAYREAGGPSLELVEAWVAAVRDAR